MDYLTAFEISASGMSVEKLRADVSAINMANANTTRGTAGTVYKPLRVVSAPRYAANFDGVLGVWAGKAVGGIQGASIQEMDVEPRMAYEPNHPSADDKGFVPYANVNPVSEMLNMITATRSYEANVRAMNAAKTMALKALEIGGGS